MNYSMKKILAGALMLMGAATLTAQERVVDFYFLDPSSVTLSPNDLTAMSENGLVIQDGTKNNYLCRIPDMPVSSEGVTLIASKGAGGAEPRFFWKGGTTIDDDDIYMCDFRVYKSNTLSVTAPEGCTITKIVMYPKVTTKNETGCCDKIKIDADCGGTQTITGGKNQWVADENGEGLQKVTYTVGPKAQTQSVYRMYVTLKGTASITDIAADSEEVPVEYFDLNGRQVKADSLNPGLYIRRQGQKSEKMLVKPGLNQ